VLGVRARDEAILQCLEIFRWTSQYGQKARSTRGKIVLCLGESPERLPSTNPLHRQGIRQARHIPRWGYAVPDYLINQRSLVPFQ
jgi:hypothetical protein